MSCKFLLKNKKEEEAKTARLETQSFVCLFSFKQILNKKLYIFLC